MTDTLRQTTNPMDDLRQASADVSGVEVFSPAAQAVLDAYMNNCGRLDGPLEKDYRCAAAVLLAAAVYSYCPMDRQRLAAIAAELEGSNA